MGRVHLEDLGVDEKIISEQSLRRRVRTCNKLSIQEYILKENQ
jgi:hypothetical protein